MSIETGTLILPFNAFKTGSSLSHSSLSETGIWPGLVDCAPISIISAPSSISLRAHSTASSGEKWSPPSEKLSGVTFTMPIINTSLPYSISLFLHFQIIIYPFVL